MANIDVQHIWQQAKQEAPVQVNYSMEDIQKYRLNKSRQTTRTSRLSILFDIGFKAVISLMLMSLLVIRNASYTDYVVVGLLLGMIGVLIIVEVSYIRKLRLIKDTNSIIQNLKDKLQYFQSAHRKFIFISALSSPLFVLSGFFLYYHFKYDQILLATPIDDPIPYLFLVAAFAISWLAQGPAYRMQIKELKASLEEIDDVTLTALEFEESRKAKRKYVIAGYIILLIGVLALLLFLFKTLAT